MADFKGIQEQYDDINQVGSRPVGLMTEFTTEAGRPIYISHNGEIVSEKSTTIPYNGKYVNVPSIHDGIEYSEFELIKLLDEKKIKPTSTHKTQELAVKAAQKRSPSLMSEETARAVESKYWREMTKRKATADQILGDSSTELVTPDAKAESRMDDLQAIQEDEFLDLYGEGEKSQKLDAYMSTLSEDDKSDIQSYLDKPTPKINSIEGDEAMAKGRARRNDVDETVTAFNEGGYEDGGLKDEGGTVDPVSGNDVPSGSTQSEVRDDIPAQLSEGEFVLPADVVRYIGLENLMELRNKAKQGLAQMEAMGQMGNSEEATMPDTADMEVDIDAMIDEFDPNDPETLSFAPGGYVAPSLTSPSSMQGGSAQGIMQPPQQGFQAPVYQAPGVPTGQQLLGGASPVVYGNQEYIGPNNEIINITTVNGNPIQPVPTGYRLYNRATESPVSPVVEKPKVIEDTRNSGLDDREAENQRQADYDTFTNTMTDLAALSKNQSFKDSWGKSVHNPKNKQTLGSVLSTNIVGNVMDDINMNTMANEEVEAIAENLGIDLAPHTNKFSLFGLNKYDKESFVAEAKAVNTVNAINAIAESLGVDAKDLSRTNIDVNKDGKISEEEAKVAEEALFMTDEITDEEIDALTSNDSDGPSDTDTSPETGPSSGTSPGRPGGEAGERGGPDAGDTSENTGGPSSGGTTSSGSPTAGGDQDFAKGGSVVDQTERALKSSRRKSKK